MQLVAPYLTCNGFLHQSCIITKICVNVPDTDPNTKTDPTSHLVQFATYQNIFSFRIFGDLDNYTFLKTLGPTESEKLHLLFSKHPMPMQKFCFVLSLSWIFKMATVFS